MTSDFIPGSKPPAKANGPAWWFVYSGRRLLIGGGDDENRHRLPRLDDPAGLGLKLAREHFIGLWDGAPCYVAEALGDPGEVEPPEGMVFVDLRRLYLWGDEEALCLAGRAVQILDWDRLNVFCGRCGERMAVKPDERAKECPACGLVKFPRLSPAVIVLVRRDDRILLARSPHFPEGMHSTIAGFVEPGETLEEAVVREVKEEVGVEVTDVRYFGSQPWPFPDSLMIGFSAVWAGGEIEIDGREIVSAGWFGRDDLPRLPGGVSIARKLIDSFLDEESRP